MALPIRTYKLTMNPWRPLEEAKHADLMKSVDVLSYIHSLESIICETHAREIAAMQYSFGEDEEYWGNKVNEAIEWTCIVLGAAIASTAVAIGLAIKLWVG